MTKEKLRQLFGQFMKGQVRTNIQPKVHRDMYYELIDKFLKYLQERKIVK